MKIACTLFAFVKNCVRIKEAGKRAGNYGKKMQDALKDILGPMF